jgi:hypothetical protein
VAAGALATGRCWYYAPARPDRRSADQRATDLESQQALCRRRAFEPRAQPAMAHRRRPRRQPYRVTLDDLTIESCRAERWPGRMTTSGRREPVSTGPRSQHRASAGARRRARLSERHFLTRAPARKNRTPLPALNISAALVQIIAIVCCRPTCWPAC